MIGPLAKQAIGVLVALLWAGAATAQPQPWEVLGGDTGTYVWGLTRQPGMTIEIGCTAPSPQGRPAIETYSHEMLTTDPFQVYLRVPDPLFVWSPPYWQRGARLIVDDIRHVLPDFQLNELQGTAAMVPMDSPVVLGLFDTRAPAIALVSPQDRTHAQSTNGLRDAMIAALRPCVERWQQMGHSLPAALAPILAPAATGIPRFDLSGAAPSPVTRVADLPAPIAVHVNAQCNGTARIEESALSLPGDLDFDGRPDYAIHYGGVLCQPGDQRLFCGAANCSIEVFGSSRGYAPIFEFLGLDVRPEVAADGRLGLRLSATRFICADGHCDRPWVWNGRTFSMN